MRGLFHLARYGEGWHRSRLILAPLLLSLTVFIHTGCASFAARRHLLKGQEAEKRGNLLEARQRYGNAIKAKPTSWKGWYRLGALALDDRRTALARDCFKEAIALNEDNPLLWHQLGVAHWRLDENAEAIAAFRRGLDIEPGYGPIHYALGLFFERRNKPRQALDSYLLAWEYGIRTAQLQQRIRRLNTTI